MALLPLLHVTRAGVEGAAGGAEVLVAATAGGDTFRPTGALNLWYVAQNPTGGAITVTIRRKIASNYGGVLTNDDIVQVVPAGARVPIGPIDGTFVDPVTGLVTVNYSAGGLNVSPLYI